MIMAAANNCLQAIIAATKGRLLTASILRHDRRLIKNEKTKIEDTYEKKRSN